MPAAPSSATLRWPHRLAVVLAAATFPLIWIGGMVTTYDAGMAVPDWPTTYGWNLFLYPWQTWVLGSFDLFIEHGHRLFASAVGLLTILLLLAVWRWDRRRWLVASVGAALALVLFQGFLGGARVIWDERTLALAHGCVGPLFFAWTAGLALFTSRWWSDASAPHGAPAGSLVRLTWFASAIIYIQLILGALLRHVPLGATPGFFQAALLFHLVGAALLVVLAGALVVQASAGGSPRFLAYGSQLLAGLMSLQLLLGLATWVAKFAWPGWFQSYQFAAAYTVVEKSLGQSLVTTAHVANGSLILATAFVLALAATRRSGLSWAELFSRNQRTLAGVAA